MDVKKVSVFGLGYVGLTFSVCLASRGFNVVGVDVDTVKVKLINSGETPFYESKLKDLLTKVLGENNFRCTINAKEAVLNSFASFICVGTPSKPDGSIDLKYIRSVSRSIGVALKDKDDYHLIVVRSTVTPGTTRNIVKRVVERFSGKKCGVDFGLCMNPEFLREGSAINDIFNSDRVIIGEFDSESGDLLKRLYVEFYGDDLPPMLRTTLENAEFIKYANNAFLAMKISFINEIANICEKVKGADVTLIARGLGLDHRINHLFLNAGLGWGGSCFPKDLDALIAFSKKLSYNPILLDAVRRVNELQPLRAVEMAKKLIRRLKGKRIAILGLAFKPGTDDMRNAVSIGIINKLIEEGAVVVAYDPAAMDNAKKIFGDSIEYASSIVDCLRDADCAILVTEWDEFRELTPEDFIKYMKTPAVIDGRRIFHPKEFSSKLKFAAIGLGKFVD
ncbi:MAG: UDP-glucose/GDP-mannose dehydrogenase family protein [archaeon GB-1867-035]|nr:UDP-glucose/GDP-mannose dehydrogenase family protein [Candidatus Culexmicrobium profundum]